MAQKLSLAEKVVNFLQQNPEQKFIYTELASSIRETYLDEYRQKPLKQLAAEISRLIPQLERYPKVKIIESRPRRYYFTESTDSDEIDRAESSEASPVSKEKEHDLYPVLSEFLLSDKIYSKRIDETHSRNVRGSGGNKWLYPDLVGVEYLSLNWDREIKDCVGKYADKQTKLWSFEVKRKIRGRDVREAFFQAVSNSSWANFGYLVASEIEGSHTLPELRMLANLHGIGFIRLEAEAPVESQIMIPAKERSEIDWDTANRLTKANDDFKKYIELIREYYQSGAMRESDWYMRVEGD